MWHCVVDEIDDLHAYRPGDDTFVRMPMRVAFHSDYQIEIGPLDLCSQWSVCDVIW